MLLQGCAGLHVPTVQFGACQGLIHAIVTPFWTMQASQFMGLHNQFKTGVESDASEAPVSCLAWPLEQLPPIQQKIPNNRDILQVLCLACHAAGSMWRQCKLRNH